MVWVGKQKIFYAIQRLGEKSIEDLRIGFRGIAKPLKFW